MNPRKTHVPDANEDSQEDLSERLLGKRQAHKLSMAAAAFHSRP